MKKLFLLALVAVSISSYGEVISILEKGSGEKYSGSGSLTLTSRGEIVNVQDKLYLKLTPTASAGPDMTSLEFNFGQLKAGSTGNVTGKFKAEVFKGAKTLPGEDTPIKLTQNNIEVGFFDSSLGAISDEDNISTDILVKDTTDDAVPGTPLKIGTLQYSLSEGSGLNNNNYTYVGEIVAEVQIEKNVDYTGLFIDKGAKIQVEVKEITDPSPAA